MDDSNAGASGTTGLVPRDRRGGGAHTATDDRYRLPLTTMRLLDERLLRRAKAARRLLVLDSALGVAGAVLIVVQATLIARIVTRVKAAEFLFIAGQVATDPNGKVVGADDFDAQCRQTFANVEAALKSASAGWSNVVEFTTYMVHSQDIAKFMAFRLREFPKMFANGVYPPNTLLIVDRLVQEPFLVEVQTRAAL